MGIIGWIVLGLLAGIVAKAIFPGGERLGLILTTLLGIGGALLGGLVASLVGLGDPIDEFFDFSTWAAAIVGALAILWVASKLGVGSGCGRASCGAGASLLSGGPPGPVVPPEAEHADARPRKDLEVPDGEPRGSRFQGPLDQPTVDAADHGRALPGQVGERATAHSHVQTLHVRLEAVVAEDAGERRDGPSPGRRR